MHDDEDFDTFVSIDGQDAFELPVERTENDELTEWLISFAHN